jgi:hypothetical protein
VAKEGYFECAEGKCKNSVMPRLIKNRVWNSEGGAGPYYSMFTYEKLFCVPRNKSFVRRV